MERIFLDTYIGGKIDRRQTIPQSQDEFPAAGWGGASEHLPQFVDVVLARIGLVNVQVSGVNIHPVKALMGRIPGWAFAEKSFGIKE